MWNLYIQTTPTHHSTLLLTFVAGCPIAKFLPAGGEDLSLHLGGVLVGQEHVLASRNWWAMKLRDVGLLMTKVTGSLYSYYSCREWEKLVFGWSLSLFPLNWQYISILHLTMSNLTYRVAFEYHSCEPSEKGNPLNGPPHTPDHFSSLPPVHLH